MSGGFQRPLFLGLGNMAQALAIGLARRPEFSLKAAHYFTPSQLRAKKFATQHGGTSLSNIPSDFSSYDCLFLGMKPQQAADALTGLKGRLPPDLLVISMMAGVRLEQLEQYLAHQNIIRIMPNLACAEGLSPTPWSAHPSLDPALYERFLTSLSTIGTLVQLDEELINLVTVHLSSMPALVYWLADLLQKDLTRIGIEEKLARTLLTQMLQGSVHKLESFSGPWDDLKKSVISKAGVTHSFLQRLGAQKFEDEFLASLKAGQERAKEL
jgi:pyrroline-5-carboxylate reductase